MDKEKISKTLGEHSFNKYCIINILYNSGNNNIWKNMEFNNFNQENDSGELDSELEEVSRILKPMYLANIFIFIDAQE